MDYIAFAFIEPVGNAFDSLRTQALNYGFDLIVDEHLDIDNEVSPGLRDFCSDYGINQVIFVNKPKNATTEYESGQISDELCELHHSGKQSKFLEFITTHLLLFKPAYLMLCLEWDLGARVYLQKKSVTELEEFFRGNLSRYVMKYNYQHDYYLQDFEIPVLIELIHS